MNISILGKALLNLYKYLEPMTQSIDKLISSKAENFDASIGENVETLTSEIINLTERKVSLINVKVLIDKAIARLSKENKRVIILKYIDNMYMNDFVELLGITERTYFRKINIAFQAFCKTLMLENSLNGNILSKYEGQRWFLRFLDCFDESNKKTNDRINFCDRLFKQVREVC